MNRVCLQGALNILRAFEQLLLDVLLAVYQPRVALFPLRGGLLFIRHRRKQEKNMKRMLLVPLVQLFQALTLNVAVSDLAGSNAGD